MPKISIIIPVYNVEKYIEKCIDSVLAQTFTDFECVLIDDGSPDNSGKICGEYAKKDERIKVIHQKNGGVSSARNAGLDIAQGEWICFIDSDDWVEKNYLELMYNNAINNNCDLSVCGWQIIDKDSHIKEESLKHPVMLLDKTTAKKKLFHGKSICLGVVCKLFKREYIYNNDIRFNTQIKIGEDTLFCFEVIDKINKITVVDSTSCYNILNNEESATRGAKALDNYVTSFIAIKKMLEIETDKRVLRKIRAHESRMAGRMCGVILLQHGNFNKEKYAFYRGYFLKSMFYFLVYSHFSIIGKVRNVSYLFPKVYYVFAYFAKKIRKRRK